MNHPSFLYISLLCIFTSLSSCTYPIAIFHGIGDHCGGLPGSLISKLQQHLDTHIECIEIGDGKITSIFTELTKQGEEACAKLSSNPHFQDKFTVFGISQGTLISRYVIEACEMPGQVVKFLSFDGPLMGIGQIPDFDCGVFCDIINGILSALAYNEFLVENVAPASYFRYKKNYNGYSQHNDFMNNLNNEHGFYDENYRERFLQLENVMLIKTKEDKVITPKESSWFEFWDEKGERIVPLTESSFYINDNIGLRTLNEEGKVQFVEFEGGHVSYSDEELLKFVDFLK